MAEIRSYGVGTGWSESGITGAKSTFAYDEQIYAEHVWDDVSKNDIFTIKWYREEPSGWKLQTSHSWTNSEGYTNIYHWAWIKDWTPGFWKAEFNRNNIPRVHKSFTIKEAPAPPAPTPEPIKKASIYITSNPSGAEIYGDGVDLGETTPFTWFADAGYHSITVKLAGYEDATTTGFFAAGEYLEPATLILKKIVVGVPWYEKWFGWTLEDIKNLVFLNPIQDILALAKVLDNLLPEKWTEQKVQIPDWLYEIGLWLFWGPAFVTAVEGMIKAGASSTEANSIVATIKDKGFIKALDIMKANPLKYADDFAKLDETLASQILKGMKKDQLASLAREVFVKAWNQKLIAEAPILTRIIEAITPKTVIYGFSGLLGLLGMAYGISFGTEWFAKEGLIEPISFPLYDRVREYRKNPTPELKALIEADIKKFEDSLVKAEKLIKAVAWLWPLTKDFWYDYVDNIKFELEATKKELEEVIPAVEKGRLIIYPIPSDSKVSVQGQIPSTGVFDMEIEAAIYSYTVSRYGYISKSDQASVEAGEVRTINVTLDKEPAKPTAEEDWEEIEKRIAEWKEQQRIAEAEYWEKIKAEQEALKLSQKEIDEEYWARIREEEALRREEERKADEEYWAKVMENMALEREARRIEAAEYYKQIYEEQLKREEAKRAADKEYWDAIYAEREATEYETPGPSYLKPYTPIEYEPYYPSQYPTLPAPNYDELYEYTPIGIEPVDVVRPYARELIVNIETTDVLPFKGKLYSIAFIDLSDPLQESKVITSDNEEDLVRTFLDWFDGKGFTRIIGFNVSFDHRFIFTKAALYRRQAKIWANIEMRDIMQILQQVKEAFVYNMNKAGTLDDWGKHLLGYGKYGKQEECLARFIRGDFDYVDAFNINQVNLIYDLYALLRFTLSEAQIKAEATLQSTIAPEVIPEYPLVSSLPQKKKCPNCLQENELTATSCIVCGAAI